MRPQYWRRALRTAGWMRPLSGWGICENSTLPPGVVSWIASLGAIHANRSASPANGEATKMTATYGLVLPPLSRPSGPAGASSRTFPDTSRWDSIRSARTYREWATALRQEYSARPKLGPVIGASGCSSWPTAKVATGDYSYSQGDKNKPVPNLQGAAKSWGTPRASDGEKGGPNSRDGSGSLHLASQAVMWPTPATRDYRSPNSQDSQDRRNAGSARGQQLPNFVADLSRSSRPAQPTPDGPQSSETSRVLSPLFVERLMGLPQEWTSATASTDCGPAVMPSCHWWRRMRGSLSTLCSAPMPKYGQTKRLL